MSAGAENNAVTLPKMPSVGVLLAKAISRLIPFSTPGDTILEAVYCNTLDTGVSQFFQREAPGYKWEVGSMDTFKKETPS